MSAEANEGGQSAHGRKASTSLCEPNLEETYDTGFTTAVLTGSGQEECHVCFCFADCNAQIPQTPSFLQPACFAHASYATYAHQKSKGNSMLMIENTWKGRTSRQQLWSRLAIHLSVSVDNMISKHQIIFPTKTCAFTDCNCNKVFFNTTVQNLIQAQYREVLLIQYSILEGKSRQISLRQSPFQTKGVSVKVMVTKKTRIKNYIDAEINFEESPNNMR